MVQASKTASTIHHLCDAQGTLTSKNENIAKQFEIFYSKLYNLKSGCPDPPPPDSRAKHFRDFLSQYGLKTITHQQSKEMESPLTVEELETAIKQMKPCKSPGPDGFNLQYYKSFLDALSSKLLSTYNAFSNPQTSPGRMLEAHITVLPKEGKDPLHVSSYRPLSLLNLYIKVYAKILTNRMLPFIPNLISLNQVGFVPGREARDNTILHIESPSLAHEISHSGIFLLP